jgi:hypothetical protein
MKRLVIQTVGGRKFDFLNPTFDISDIAHGLSNICRFTGHTDRFYSVAQHSVLVSYLVPNKHAFAGLLHDAHEAYMGDVSTPLKALLPDYKRLEHSVERSLHAHFGLPEVNHPSVKRADLVMLATEKAQLLHPTVSDERWELLDGVPCLTDVLPGAGPLVPWPPYIAKKLFLERYRALFDAKVRERRKDLRLPC